MSAFYPDQDQLVGLAFESERDVRACIDLFLKLHPDGYISLADEHTVVMTRDASGQIREKLDRRGIKSKMMDVISSDELPPEEAAEVRSERGRVPDLDVKKDIERLKKKYKLG